MIKNKIEIVIQYHIFRTPFQTDNLSYSKNLGKDIQNHSLFINEQSVYSYFNKEFLNCGPLGKFYSPFISSYETAVQSN